MRRHVVAAFVLVAAALPAGAEPARLGVVLVIDQLSQAQLDRASDLLGEGGLKRILGEGSTALDARYLGAPTVTAHGHTTLATGTYGRHHGIVGNSWWEREKGETAYVGHDPSYRLLAGRETRPRDGTAPTQQKAMTLADALRWTHPTAKVVALSLKDRGAIMMGGVRPNAAIWYDAPTDRWTTSTFYAEQIPSWVPTTAVSGTHEAWDRLSDPRLCRLLPKAERASDPAVCAERLYLRRVGPDDDPAETGDIGFGNAFPHRLPPPGQASRGEKFSYTALADEALFALAALAVEHEQLGQDEVPDLLTVSASAFDLLGHDFGPESQESLDALLRVDAAVARFLSVLDQRVGRGRYVVALSADHGVQPAAEKMRRQRLSAGRLRSAELFDKAEAALDQAFGARDYLSPYRSAGFSFRPGALRGIDPANAEAVVMEALRGVDGVAAVYPRSIFMSQAELRGDAGIYARSYFDGRSPDFIIQPRPLWVFGEVASHGSPYLADRRVPLAFYRGGRRGTRIPGVVDVASLSPTLAMLIGSAPPAAATAPILTSVVDQLR